MFDGEAIDPAAVERIADAAVTRGSRIKARRRAAVVSAVCLSVAGITIGVVAASAGGPATRGHVVAVSSPTTNGYVATPVIHQLPPDLVAGASTTTTPPAVHATAVPKAGVTTPTVTTPFVTTPIVTLPPGPVVTTTVPPTTTTTVSPYPTCGEDNFGATLTTNKTTYTVGESVVITDSYDNPLATCTPDQSTICPPFTWLTVETMSGAVVWNYRPAGESVQCNQPVPDPMDPGVWASDTASWAPQVPAGTYQVFVNAPDAPVDITFVAPPSTTTTTTAP